MKSSGVIILTLSPYTSNKFQPLALRFLVHLRRAIMGLLMVGYYGKPVAIYYVDEIVGLAFLKSMTPINIMNIFKKCGIFTFDQNLFIKDNFLPSTVADRPCSKCKFLNNIEPSTGEQTGPSNI